MTNLVLYLDILRRRWWLVAVLTLAVLLLSLVSALARPVSYTAQARVLVSRDADPAFTTGMTPNNEDRTAQDLPAIIASVNFRNDLAARLQTQGLPISADALVGMVSSTTDASRVVTIDVTAATPETAMAVAQAIVEQVREGGLRYWDDPAATAEHTGLEMIVIKLPETASRNGGLRSQLQEVGLRTIVGLMAGVALAFAWYALEQWQQTRSVKTS